MPYQQPAPRRVNVRFLRVLGRGKRVFKVSARVFIADLSTISHLNAKLIGDFRITFRLCFKASPSAKPFIWKLVLFTCKLITICV